MHFTKFLRPSIKTFQMHPIHYSSEGCAFSADDVTAGDMTTGDIKTGDITTGDTTTGDNPTNNFYRTPLLLK